MKLHFMLISMSSRALCGICCTKKEKVCFTFPNVLRKYTTSSVICFNHAFSGGTLTMLGIFMLLFAVAMPLHAQSPDSVCVFRYPASGEKLSLKRGDNSRQLRLLDVQMQTFRPGRDTLRMDFYSGDDSDLSVVYGRSRRLRKLVRKRYGLHEQDIRQVKHFYAHPRWGEVAEVGVLPYVVWQPVDAQKEADEAKAAADAAAFAESIRYVPVEETLGLVSVTTPDGSTGRGGTTSAATRYIAVKTNLAGWGMALANIGVEVALSTHVSLDLPFYYSGWDVSSKHALRGFLVQPEARYWLKGTGRGHFFGLHAHAGWFNLKWDRDRYQYADRPALGAGISYGYLLPFAHHWGAEFTLGAGYTNLKYDTFYNIAEGARIDTRTRNYWGITRVGISLIYHFNHTDR